MKQVVKRCGSHGRTGRRPGAAGRLCILAGVLLLLTAGGCRQREAEPETDYPEEGVTDTAAVTDEQLKQKIEAVFQAITASEYVSVSVPDGIRLQVLTDTVTEEELDRYVQDVMEGFASWEQITDRETEKGDVIALSYDIFLAGELVESMGSDMAPAMLTLPQGEEGTELQTQLIGRLCGEEFSFSISWPPASDDGRSQDGTWTEPEESDRQENGEDSAQVTAMIYWIQGERSVPRLDETFVSALTGSEEITVAQWRESLRQELAAYKKNRSDYYKQIDLWYQLTQNAQWIGYPEEMLDRYRQEVEQEYSQYAAWYGYASREEYGREVLGMTAEELGRYLEDMAAEHGREELLILAMIQEQSELQPDVSQCREKMETYAYTYGLGSDSGEEELEAIWKKVILAAAKENILSQLEAAAEIVWVDSFESD